MNTAIVFYSQSENTTYAAERLAELTGADLIRLRPKETYPDKGFRKYFWCGKSAVMGDKPELLPYVFDVSKYDCVILGSPVWASSVAPPLRTFIEEQPGVKKKDCAAFVCYSGGGAERALKKLQTDLGLKHFKAQLSLIDPKSKPKPENEELIRNFCLQLQAEEKG